jgi:formylmethanofuran dehydrogenase subunit B
VTHIVAIKVKAHDNSRGTNTVAEWQWGLTFKYPDTVGAQAGE